MQQQIVALVQAALSGDQQANQQIQQIMQAAQQGDQQATQLAQMIQQVTSQLKQSAKHGAKLISNINYIKYLRGQCPEGYEMQTFKKGGAICEKCVKRAQQGTSIDDSEVPLKTPRNVVDEFRCGRKMKAKKAGCGTKVDTKKCGGKAVDKAACGTRLPIEKCGGKSKKKLKS